MLVNRLAAALAVAAAMFAPAAAQAQGGPAMAPAPGGPSAAPAEDGYALWLRYAPLEGQAKAALERFDPRLAPVSASSDPTILVAMQELNRGLSSLLERPLAAGGDANVTLDCASDVTGPEGSYRITGAASGIAIMAADPRGCLYGSHALLRELSLGTAPGRISLDQGPAMPLRLLNHWDNPDGSVERGYAGQSIWNWHKLPGWLDPRYTDYARACASIGINGAVQPCGQQAQQ